MSIEMCACAFDKDRICNDRCIAYEEEKICGNFVRFITKCKRGNFIIEESER